MEFFVNIAESFVGDMGIDLSGGDIFVAEKFLDAAQVSSADQEVCRVAVAEGMRSNFFRKA